MRSFQIPTTSRKYRRCQKIRRWSLATTILVRIKAYALPSTISFTVSALVTGEVGTHPLWDSFPIRVLLLLLLLLPMYSQELVELEFMTKFSLFTFLGLFCSLTLCQLSPSCIHGTCVTVNETQRCNCDPGFTGYLCDSRLAPCDLDPCGDRGKCVPSADSFICQCMPWWKGT